MEPEKKRTDKEEDESLAGLDEEDEPTLLG